MPFCAPSGKQKGIGKVKVFKMLDAAANLSSTQVADLKVVREILERSAESGFLGGMDLSAQIDHALGFTRAVENVLARVPSSVMDIGTGGGIPGLVLAAVWSKTPVALLDASQKRTDFLRAEVDDWGRSAQIGVNRGRAEEWGRESNSVASFEVVVARSFGPPAVTAECAAPLLKMEGILVVSEPPESGTAIRWPADGIATLALETCQVFRYLDRFNYQVLRKTGTTPERYPRRVGIPSKRPLF